MTTILPANRTGFDVLGELLGGQISQNLGPAMQRQAQRNISNSALDQALKEIEAAGDDPNKIAVAIARVGANVPGMERALGPMAQTMMQQAAVRRATGLGTGAPQSKQPPPMPQPNSMGMLGARAAQAGATGQAVPNAIQDQSMGQEGKESPALQPQAEPSTFATPSPFNIMTPQDILAEGKRYALSLNDPGAEQVRVAQLQNQNQEANLQRGVLEDLALKADVKPGDLAKFMNVGSKFDTRNPTEWVEKTKRKFGEVQSLDKSLERAFIPGVGSAILGTDRDQAIKNLIPDVQKKVAAGLENETRNFLSANYLTPTEIEEVIHPPTKKQISSLEKLPKGVFPPKVKANWGDVKKLLTKGEMKEPNPFISYEEAREKAPKHLEEMENRLAEYFLNNVDDNTSLLPLRYKLWKEKDYDWRQIGPAIARAESMGLKLNSRQQAELADINTQAPYESLPEIFQDMDRVWRIMSGGGGK